MKIRQNDDGTYPKIKIQRRLIIAGQICKNCKWCKYNDEYNCHICHNKEIVAMMNIIVANQIMNKSDVIFRLSPLSVLLGFGCNQWKAKEECLK